MGGCQEEARARVTHVPSLLVDTSARLAQLHLLEPTGYNQNRESCHWRQVPASGIQPQY